METRINLTKFDLMLWLSSEFGFTTLRSYCLRESAWPNRMTKFVTFSFGICFVTHLTFYSSPKLKEWPLVSPITLSNSKIFIFLRLYFAVIVASSLMLIVVDPNAILQWCKSSFVLSKIERSWLCRPGGDRKRYWLGSCVVSKWAWRSCLETCLFFDDFCPAR